MTQDELELKDLMEGLRGRLKFLEACGLREVYPVRKAQVASPCGGCPLSGSAPVAGRGSASSGVMFVGGFPDEGSASKGEPFSAGEVGDTVTRMITNGMKVRREDVYVTYAVKCLPGDGVPSGETVSKCIKLLEEEVRKTAPYVIVAFGKVASQALTGIIDIESLRGRFHEFAGVKVVTTYDIYDMIKDPGLKRPVWEDLLRAMSVARGRKPGAG